MEPPPLPSRDRRNPAPQQPKNAKKGPSCCLIGAIIALVPIALMVLLGIIGAIGQKNTPGMTEFSEATKAIIGNHGAVGHGNSADAKAMAEDFAAQVKLMRSIAIEEAASDGLSLTKGEFLTYCRLNSDSVVFLVHVPKLRNFDDGAKELMAEICWMIAYQMALELDPPVQELAVGVRGALLFDSVMIGKMQGDIEESTDAIETHDKVDPTGQVLVDFFARAEHPQPSYQVEIMEEEEPEPEVLDHETEEEPATEIEPGKPAEE